MTRWTPNARERLAFLRHQVEETKNPNLELELERGIRIGLAPDGGPILRLDCDPGAVVVDREAARVSVMRGPSGAIVQLDGQVPKWTGASFFDEILALVDEGQARASAPAACLSQWRDLLSHPPGPRLGEQQLAGLFGELELLETVVQMGGGLDTWTGWQQDHVDFRLPGLAIEVKSTLSPNYRRVRIHGLQQLDDPEDGSRLVLMLQRLEASPEGRSVPEIVEDLVAAGLPLAPLLSALREVGYSEEHRATYAEDKFVSETVALRDIDDSHPRLTPDMARDIDLEAIDRVDYVLNLNAHVESDLELGVDELITRYLT